jgi:uncharacterized membrane protein
MSPGGFLKLYGLTLPILLLADAVWLGVVARGFYRRHLGELLRPDVQWWAAVAFYLLFLVGLLVLAVLPALERQSVWRAVGLGALLGFVAYATYDLTNLATLRGFPSIVAAVDLLWGTALAAGLAAAAFTLATFVH